jgi:hypothetical protein
MDLESPDVQKDAELAALCGALVLHILRFRLRAMMLLCFSWPGQVALLLHQDGAMKERLLSQMRKDDKAWGAAEKRAKWDPWWKKRMDRSCLRQPLVRRFFMYGRAVAFKKVTPAMSGVARMCYKTFGQTKLIEDLFGDQRDTETRSNKNKRMSCKRIFHRCVTSSTLWKKHKYPEVNFKDYKGDIQRNKLPKSLFKPDKKVKLSLGDKLKRILLKGDWPSFTAQGAAVMASDLALTRHCEAEDVFQLAEAAQDYNLLMQPGTVVRKKAAGASWKLSMGPIEGSAVLLWPLVEHHYIGTQASPVLFPRVEGMAISLLEWAVVTKVSDWWVLPTAWMGPWQLSILNKYARYERFFGIALYKIRDKETLMVYAVWGALLPLSQSQMASLATHLGVVSLGKTVVPLLRAFFEKYLPDRGDEDWLTIIEKRLRKKDHALAEIFESEEVQDALDPEGAAAVKKHNADEEEEDDVEQSVRDEVMRIRVKIRLKKASEDPDFQGDVAEPAKKRAKKGTVEKGTRRKIPAGEGDLTTEAFADILPSAARVHRDGADNRWRVFYGNCSMSRSWVLRPVRDCIVECARWAWDSHFSATGEKCSVSGLYNRR